VVLHWLVVHHVIWSDPSPKRWRWSHDTTDGQSVSMSWRRSQFGTCNQILVLSEFCCLVSVGRPVWREVGSVSCQSLSAILVHLQVFFVFLFISILHATRFMYIQYMQGLVSPGSVQQLMLHHLLPTLQQQSKHLNCRAFDRHQV
jgi:hypothetical protein